MAPEPSRTNDEARSAGRVVRVARAVEEVEELRSSWASFASTQVRTNVDHFLWTVEHDPKALRPHVLAAESDGRIEAILIGRLASTRLRCALGYRRVYAPTLRAISVLPDGLLGSDAPDVTRAFVDELVASLGRGEANALLLRNVRLGSRLHEAATQPTRLVWRERGAMPDRRWEIALPSTLDEYVGSLSPSTRKGIRRTSKRLEERFGDRLALESFRDVDELDAFVRDAETVAARSYQRQLGVGFSPSAFELAALRLSAARDWFRGYCLYLDGRPVAFELGEVYGGRYRSLAGAYDPALAEHRVGAQLLVKVVESLAVDPAVVTFDFGIGDAEYKRKLSHTSVDETDVVLYARRPGPTWVALARTTTLGLTRAVTALLERLGLFGAVHARRRRHLLARGRSGGRTSGAEGTGSAPLTVLSESELRTS